MKINMKYVNAGLSVLALACLFMNMLEIAFWKFSGLKILQMGFGMEAENEWLQYALYYVQEYVRNFAIILIVIILVSVISAVLNCLLPDKAANCLSAILAFVNLVCVSLVYGGLLKNIYQIDEVLSFLGADAMTEIKHGTFVVWILFYVAIIGVSVAGFLMAGKKKMPVKGEIYTEQFYGRQNPLQNAAPVYQRAATPREVQQFHGAIVGKAESYFGRTFPLNERMKMYFAEENGVVVLSGQEGQNTLASVYYASDRQSYFVQPAERRCVYLASGQPLGAGREYYLPRGTEIYIKERKNRFELA